MPGWDDIAFAAVVKTSGAALLTEPSAGIAAGEGIAVALTSHEGSGVGAAAACVAAGETDSLATVTAVIFCD